MAAIVYVLKYHIHPDFVLSPAGITHLNHAGKTYLKNLNDILKMLTEVSLSKLSNDLSACGIR